MSETAFNVGQIWEVSDTSGNLYTVGDAVPMGSMLIKEITKGTTHGEPCLWVWAEMGSGDTFPALSLPAHAVMVVRYLPPIGDPRPTTPRMDSDELGD